MTSRPRTVKCKCISHHCASEPSGYKRIHLSVRSRHQKDDKQRGVDTVRIPVVSVGRKRKLDLNSSSCSTNIPTPFPHSIPDVAFSNSCEYDDWDDDNDSQCKFVFFTEFACYRPVTGP